MGKIGIAAVSQSILLFNTPTVVKAIGIVDIIYKTVDTLILGDSEILAGIGAMRQCMLLFITTTIIKALVIVDISLEWNGNVFYLSARIPIEPMPISPKFCCSPNDGVNDFMTSIAKS